MAKTKSKFSIDYQATLTNEELSEIWCTKHQKEEYIARQLLVLYKFTENALAQNPSETDKEKLEYTIKSLTIVWKILNSKKSKAEKNIYQDIFFFLSEAYECISIFCHEKNQNKKLAGLRKEWAIKAANTKHKGRQEILERAKTFVSQDLEGNCNPSWTTADYFNYLRNDLKNNKRDDDANLLVSDDALKEAIRNIFRHCGVPDRIATGPARHIKRRK